MSVKHFCAARTGYRYLTIGLLLVMTLGLSLGGITVGEASAESGPFPPAVLTIAEPVFSAKPDSGLHLAPQLATLASTYRAQGVIGLRALAGEQRLTLRETRVLVVIEGDAGMLRATLEALGVTLDSVANDRFSAFVPAAKLETVAALPGVRYVRPPLPAIQTAFPQAGNVTSEGVATLEADVWHNAGQTGRNVVAAIVDFGFYNWQSLQSTGDLPANTICVDFTSGNACGNSDATAAHGSAVAEIFYDMAPGIETLYLYAFDDDADIAAIVDHMLIHEVRVAGLAVTWTNGEPYDGSGPISSQINRARTQGDIFFVVAAGNFAQQHYEATFARGDCSATTHDFDTSGACGNLNGLGYHATNESICLFMTWNAWPQTNQDYDLRIYRYNSGSPTLVAAFQDSQNGADPPVEGGCLAAPVADYYYFMVYKYSANKNHYFEIFSWDSTFGIGVAESSVAEPATADGAVVAGAFGYNTPDQLRPYSSQGPRNPAGGGAYNNGVCGATLNSACKPDFVGPDGVSTVSYGAQSAYGTSFSVPHVMGSAALVRGAYSTYNAAAVYNFLRTYATQIQSTQQNNAWGWGRPVLGDAPLPTAVALVRFEATPQGDAIRVLWETGQELNNLGFNLYRGETPDGPWQLLNAQLIPPQYPGSVMGGVYEWLDTTLRSGAVYYYWLEDVDISGVRTSYGPIWAVAGRPAYRFYLPLITRF